MARIGEFFDKAQKVCTISLVWLVTGSEKSPPGGDTAPINVTEPFRAVQCFDIDRRVHKTP